MDRLLTIDEVAAMTRLSVNTIRWMKNQDTGIGARAGKLGRRLFWREQDVITWVNEQFKHDERASA